MPKGTQPDEALLKHAAAIADGSLVADDGHGFDPNVLLEILEPPEGGEAAPGTAERGYALAYAMCRAMGIGFVMDSAPGGGTRTTIKLPIKPAAVPSNDDAPVAEEEVPHVAIPEEALPDDAFPDEALTEDLSPVPAPRSEA